MAAQKLAPLVFVRPSELRGAERSEFDLEAGEWLISTGAGRAFPVVALEGEADL